MKDPILQKRIDFLRSNLRMTQVMDHFGHRYRLHGNMRCPFHDDTNPSARLYDEQNTFWCWTCSPDHGVDVIEYVILELSLVEDIRTAGNLPKEKVHALATFRGIEYLETEFKMGYALQPWEQRLQEALRRELPPEDPGKYWRKTHTQILKLLISLSPYHRKTPVLIYAHHMQRLVTKKNSPISEQRPLWIALREDLTQLPLSA